MENAIKANNPHVKYLDFDSHGYSVLDVTPAGVQMDWYVLAERTDPRLGARSGRRPTGVPAGTRHGRAPAPGRLA